MSFRSSLSSYLAKYKDERRREERVAALGEELAPANRSLCYCRDSTYLCGLVLCGSLLGAILINVMFSGDIGRGLFSLSTVKLN